MYWGTSEWSGVEIMEAHRVAEKLRLIGPTMEQPQYNLFERNKMENEFLEIYKNVGLGTTIWSPLASGLLSGKYNDGIPADSRATLPGYDWLWKFVFTPERLEKVKALVPISQELGCTMAQFSLAWCLKNPHVSTVITGASKVEQVHENMKALDVVPKLTAEVMERIEGILGNKPGKEEE